MIPSVDLVRLLSAFMEGTDLSDLYGTFGRTRKNQDTALYIEGRDLCQYETHLFKQGH